MSFWAPFVLVHLGGQDTITAFSRQDNELWLRHLWNLVTQVVVAGYVVSKASWPDSRLRAAMVLMFLSGCFKYAERTGCLYVASPARLRSSNIGTMPRMLGRLQEFQIPKSFEERHKDNNPRGESPEKIFDSMMKRAAVESSSDIMSVDAPINEAIIIDYLDILPDTHKEFLSNPDRYDPYKFVGACLLGWYKRLYTKNPLRHFFFGIYQQLYECLCQFFRECFRECFRDCLCGCLRECLGDCLRNCFDDCGPSSCSLVNCLLIILQSCFFIVVFCLLLPLMLLYPLFQYFSALIALVLFMASEKGGHLHTIQSDITVSYILLVGAIFLDVSSVIISLFSFMVSHLPNSGGMIKRAILRVANYIHQAWSRKQWSEELAQYNMIKMHATQDTSSIGKLLGSCGLELFDVTHTPMTKDNKAPIKEFVLANLLYSGTRKEWNIASSRGHLAVQNWIVKNHHDPNSAATGKVLEKIITSGLDFPTSVLTWHIATDICYFWEGSSTCSSGAQLKNHKEMSRELSNYLMYLIFKCSVMLSSNSQIVHDITYVKIKKILSRKDGQSQKVTLDEKATVMKVFEAMDGTQKEREEPAEMKNNAADSHLQKLVQSAQATISPVLPHAAEVAQTLINIEDEANRWDLIASVWSEMLFYTAPRCGCAFHYEQLSVGGEFITHVLLLMKLLGPFLPPPGA
ncbi:unnamed protein product [Urochloa humidicola]